MGSSSNYMLLDIAGNVRPDSIPWAGYSSILKAVSKDNWVNTLIETQFTVE